MLIHKNARRLVSFAGWRRVIFLALAAISYCDLEFILVGQV